MAEYGATEEKVLSILRLAPHFYWPHLREAGWPAEFDPIGGMQLQVYRTAVELDSMGKFTQQILTMRIPGAPASWQISRSVTIRGFRTALLPIRTRVRGLADLHLGWAIRTALDLLANRRRYAEVDVVHAHLGGSVPAFLVALFARFFLQKPTILTLNCCLTLTYVPLRFGDRIAYAIGKRLEILLIRNSDFTIVLQRRSIPLMAAATRIPESRFVFIPDAVDITTFSSSANHSSSECPYLAKLTNRRPVGSYLIGFVGRIAGEKGWRLLVDGIRELRDEKIHWIIIGDGPEMDLLAKRIQDQNLTEFITLTGFIPNECVGCAMKEMDLLVVPSAHEELCGVILEAMASRLPIVATRVGGVPEVLGEGERGLLIDQRDARSLAAAVRVGLVEDGYGRSRLDAGVAAVKQTYSLPAIVEQLSFLYEVAARRRLQSDLKVASTSERRLHASVSSAFIQPGRTMRLVRRVVRILTARCG